MEKETSVGCIIFDKYSYSKVLLVYEKRRNFWGFPKGHIEEGETEFDTALREVKEEVGLDVNIFDKKYRYVMNYIIEDKQIEKTTILYLAETKDMIVDVKNQEEEIEESKWLNIKDAYNTLTFDNSKELFTKAWEDMQKIKALRYVRSIYKKYSDRGISNIELELACMNKVEELIEERKAKDSDKKIFDITEDHYFTWHIRQTITRMINLNK